MSPIKNESPDMKVWVTVGSCETGGLIPPAQEPPLLPQSTTTLPHIGGSGVLFVWNENRQVLWRGYVPLSGKKLIRIFPEKHQVYYENEEMPECPEIEHFGDPICKGKKNGDSWKHILRWFLILLVLFLLLYCLWRWLCVQPDLY